MTESVKLSLEELDIIGDIDDSEDEEPSDVTIHCKGITCSLFFCVNLSETFCKQIIVDVQ